MTCKWRDWYTCSEPVVKDDLCEKHLNTKCMQCGAQAVRICFYASSLACGKPLCKDCNCSWHNM